MYVYLKPKAVSWFRQAAGFKAVSRGGKLFTQIALSIVHFNNKIVQNNTQKLMTSFLMNV